jgi:hypothetical protein
MIQLEEFAVSGVFGTWTPGADRASVLADLGEPDAFQRQRRAMPALAKYGDIELRFFDDVLIHISIVFWDGKPPDGGGVSLAGFWPDARRSIGAVADLLTAQGAGWRIDEAMAELYPDDDSPAWITDRGVWLSFSHGQLEKLSMDQSTS